MSLTSILDTARKLGIPVVITNDRGDAPQVVMPFEDFASMVGVNLQKERKPRLTSIPKTKDEVVQALEDLKEEGRIPDEEMFGVSSEEIVNLPPEADRLLEDHFYFEPLDDKESP
ncbi:MAG: hypothetical protein KIH65_001180 [Candidatus Uhrbacteria bacterium]|nr:hypothetical protein [Candidatus Uhrbacteria bacterium]